MSDKTLYYTALERLSKEISGSHDFEEISHILAKFMLVDYQFDEPTGGMGTRDGGHDGHDWKKKAKLACSLEVDYKSKIRKEVEKSKINGDLQIFYFTNQAIPEEKKIEVHKKYQKEENIDIAIYGIVDLAGKIEEYFKEKPDADLYDLLGLSKLINGERYRRGDAKPLDINYNGNLYKKKILISNYHKRGFSEKYAETRISENPLLDFILSEVSCFNWDDFQNITICGIGYLGKSLLMKLTNNNLIKEFADEKNHSKYRFLPFIMTFIELKYYKEGCIEKQIKNSVEPLFVFLDGLDEVNESNRICLDKELQNILTYNGRVRFIISGRNSSFIDLKIFPNSVQLYLEKYIAPDDTELLSLIDEYKGTPIADLLSIPTYRNFVLEKRISNESTLEEFYTLLVRDNLEKDKKKNDYSKEISTRVPSDIDIDFIVKELSDFCYVLFLDKRLVFSEEELQKRMSNNNCYIFIIHSSIIDYRDTENISFISNFYYEYFVASALIKKDKKEVIRIFLLGGKIRIPMIDIFVLFLNCVKAKRADLYHDIFKIALKDNIVYLLLCEFDSLEDKDRYDYYISIFKKYKNEKRYIYYGRFKQSYGPLKNIDNMAQRMQMLLPQEYRSEAIRYLRAEILGYLKNPSEEKIIAFANAVILLIPFIDDLWPTEELNIMKELSLPLIQFFLKNSYAREIKGLLSQHFIFEWYKRYNWTNGWRQSEWEQLIKSILGNDYKLESEITDQYEYIIKFDILSNHYKDIIIKPMLFPLLRYMLKDGRFYQPHRASFVPDTITDSDSIPIIEYREEEYIIGRILKNIEMHTTEILSILIFMLENNLYKRIKNIFDSPVKILEGKLYENIDKIKKEEYEYFSIYYLRSSAFEFDERLFHVKPSKQVEHLKEYLVINTIDKGMTDKKIRTWMLRNLLHKLINFSTTENAYKYLQLIREKAPKSIYDDVISYIFYNTEHILKNTEFVNNEYNTIFEKTILIQKRKKEMIDKITQEMDEKRNKELALLLDNNSMINELRAINDFLENNIEIDDSKNSLENLIALEYEYIMDKIKYDDHYHIPSIFSENAIKILEDFYRDDITKIDKIIEYIQEFFFIPGNFYIYFYWVFIGNREASDFNGNIFNTNPYLRQKILDSINNDVFQKLENKSIGNFEIGIDSQWITPFFFYYNMLLDKIPPAWMTNKHILKLIVIYNPEKANFVTSTDANLAWFEEIFPMIKPCEIIEFALAIIDNVKDIFARIQIVRYFIAYYKLQNNDNLSVSIIDFIICSTVKMFNSIDTHHKYAEFQDIAHFWSECQSNYIEWLFPKFTVDIVLSTMKKDDKDIDYYYRELVLQYCIRISKTEQKIRIIHQIEEGMKNRHFSDMENNSLNEFLASLGQEKAILSIIGAYINGKEIKSRYNFGQYTVGCIKQSDKLLNNYIRLFFYSTEKSNERRNILLNLAQNGIRQHLKKDNFSSFEKEIRVRIKTLKKQNSWRVEQFEDYLLQMEQSVLG